MFEIAAVSAASGWAPDIRGVSKHKTRLKGRVLRISFDDEGRLAPACLKAVSSSNMDGFARKSRFQRLDKGQGVPFSADEIKDLPDVISAPRFATYLQACGNHREQALELYQWNLEISAAFIVPLQVCEVGIRNGVVEVLEKVHGANWPWSNGFIRSLPVPKNAWHYNPQDDLRRVASRMPTAGKVVADLKFAFWERTFTKGQDARLWVPHFRAAFPGVSTTTTIPVARADAFAALQSIREFRNRIAHHEPIFARNLAADYSRLRGAVHWRNPTAASWLDRIERVTALLAQKP